MTMMETSPCAHPSPETLRSLVTSGVSPKAALPLLSWCPVSLQVERMHFPATKPVQLHLRAVAADGQSQTLIAEWVGAAVADLAMTEAARLGKHRRGQALPQGLAVAADPPSGLLLRCPGFDAKLPGLRLLHDAEFAREKLAALGCDAGASVTLVAHRLGKRAVLRIIGPHHTRYARLRPVSSASGKVAFEQHRALWSALQRTGNLAIPRPLCFDDGLGLALFETLPGLPPQFQGPEGFRATHAVMTAIVTLQGLDVDAPVHHRDHELAILQNWAQRLAEVFPNLATRLCVPLKRLEQDMAALHPVQAVPCHRDLHEGQILLDKNRAGLLDFDTLRLGDPALDVGNLQAHLILATLRDAKPRRGFVAAMDNAVPHLPLARIAVWRRAALLRLALIYAFTAEPRAVIHGLIEAAE